MDLQRVGSFKVADDLALAKRITDKLEKEYPGYLWGVLFNEEGGVVQIVNESVQHPLRTNELYAFTLYLKRFDTDPDMKCVVRAGGEILERARLDRRFNRGETPTRIDGVKEKHQPI